MTRIRQTVLLLILLFIFIGSCASNTTHPQKDPEVVKRVNEILDKMDKDPMYFIRLSKSSRSSDLGLAQVKIMKMPEGRLLIENPDISLPLMFKRIDAKKVEGKAWLIYFSVFKETKSAESIPYISEYIASGSEEEAKYFKYLTEATTAAQHITSLKLIDEERCTFFYQRLDIADKLNQWYENYKTTNKQQKNKE